MQLMNTVAKYLSMSRSVQIVEKAHYENQVIDVGSKSKC